MQIFENRRAYTGKTFDIFDAVQTGGLAVRVELEENVKSCATFSFYEMDFVILQPGDEADCDGGKAIVVETENGVQWEYERNRAFDSGSLPRTSK